MMNTPLRDLSCVSSRLRACASVLLLALVALLFAPALARAQSTTPALLGDLDSDGQPTVLDLQRLLNHLRGTNTLNPQLLPAPLLPWADLDEDGLVNTNDLQLLQNAILGLGTLPNPYAAPLLDAVVTATNGTTITITGTARPHRQVLITGGRFAVFVVADASGRFSHARRQALA